MWFGSIDLRKVHCMCPWDSAFGAEFDVIASGDILVRMTKDSRLSFVHFGLPRQSLTWARSLPVRSWDTIWSRSGLVGLAFQLVEGGNQLMLFTMQRCVVLCEAGCFFSVENPELYWTWAFAVVAFVRNLPGVAVVKVYHDQFGTQYSKRPCSCTICLVCIPWQTTPRQRIGGHNFLRGRCWHNNEFRFKTSLASPCLSKLASFFPSLVRSSLVLREKAGDCVVNSNGSLQVRCRPAVSCSWTFLPARALVEFSCQSRVC